MATTDGAIGTTLRLMLHRELAAVRRSIEAYPDEESVWAERPGLPNTGGNLALHLAGNLQHFFGAVLGKTGFVRDRDSEFAARGLRRAEVLARLDAADKAIDSGMNALSADRFAQSYPEKINGRTITIQDWVIHLLSHLAYHLGQIDYHRRVVTGDSTSVGAIPVKALGSD